MDPLQALTELDAIIAQCAMSRAEHTRLMRCRQIIAAALTTRGAGGDTESA